MFDENKIIIQLQKINIKKLMNFITSSCNTNVFIIIITILYFMNIVKFNDILLLIIGLLINLNIKILFKRNRPYIQNNKIKNLSNSDHTRSIFSIYSFPSGHTMMATILAIILYKKYNNNIILLFSIIIGFTRVYLGIHYLSDVLAGILISFLLMQFKMY